MLDYILSVCSLGEHYLLQRVFSKIWWKRDNGLELFFMILDRPLSSTDVNATAHKDILDKYMLPKLWLQSEDSYSSMRVPLCTK